MEETKAIGDTSQEKTFPKAAYVYIVRCNDNTLYTGWTFDPLARLATHNAGKGAKYTRARLPVFLVYTEKLPDATAARKREIALKRLSRPQKLALIAQFQSLAE